MMKSENDKYYEELRRQRDEIEEYKKLLQEKDEILQKKEEQFKELAAFNMHLQTFKQVLEHMIKSLNDERIPMDEKLNNMQYHIRDMYKDLLADYSNRQESREKNKKAEARLKYLSKSNLKLQNETLTLKKKFNSIQTEIAILAKTSEMVDRKDGLWKAVLRIYERFVSTDSEFKKNFQGSGSQIGLD